MLSNSELCSNVDGKCLCCQTLPALVILIVWISDGQMQEPAANS